MTDDIQKWELESDRYQVEKIKIILTLSSGTLIVSLGFLNTNKQLGYKWLLYSSWLFLIGSIILGILAIEAGILRYHRAAKGKKGDLEGKEKELYKQGRVLTYFQAKTPDFQLCTFVLGLISFFLFVFFNIHNVLKW